MTGADAHSHNDRERVPRKLVATDPRFAGYRVVEVFESESGNKLTLVLAKKEGTGGGSSSDRMLRD
jgi:hypothetical protein